MFGAELLVSIYRIPLAKQMGSESPNTQLKTIDETPGNVHSLYMATIKTFAIRPEADTISITQAVEVTARQIREVGTALDFYIDRETQHPSVAWESPEYTLQEFDVLDLNRMTELAEMLSINLRSKGFTKQADRFTEYATIMQTELLDRDQWSTYGGSLAIVDRVENGTART